MPEPAANLSAVTPEQFRQLALSFPQAYEKSHFAATAFQAKGKKIFATLWAAEHRVVLKLSPIDQDVFHRFDPAVFYPVPNKWGAQGWTNINLNLVREDMLRDALQLAWECS